VDTVIAIVGIIFWLCVLAWVGEFVWRAVRGG
jgi:hypothetical protein